MSPLLRAAMPLAALLVLGWTAIGCGGTVDRTPRVVRPQAHTRVGWTGSALHTLFPDAADGGRIAAGHTWTSVPVEAAPFRELLPSWNARLIDEASFTVDVAVAEPGGERSPWLRIGEWGAIHANGGRTAFEAGKVAVDVLQGTRNFDRWWVRLSAYGGAVELDAFHVVTTRLGTRDEARDEGRGSAAGRAIAWAVPPRSQRLEDASIAGRICSPTSVAMVLAHNGVDVPTAHVAAALYDGRHDLYGNWNRAVQGAATFGVAGFLDRVGHWDEVRAHLEAGRPLIASIAFEPGGLTGAPLRRTKGHLIVIGGLDGAGGVLCFDPAAADLEGVARTYAARDLEIAWMDRGGVAYVLTGPRQGGSEPGNGRTLHAPSSNRTASPQPPR